MEEEREIKGARRRKELVTEDLSEWKEGKLNE